MRCAGIVGGAAGLEFGGSGEDSFVAVVVTKLTGALLFILLLTMVIMALLPKAVDLAPAGAGNGREGAESEPVPLSITTPEALPEAIAGRPYAVALAASGGRGALHWNIDGPLPEGLSFDSSSGAVAGNARERNAPTCVALGAGQRRRFPGHTIRSTCRLPERQAADHPRVVEARSTACTLAGLARTRDGVPCPLASPPRGHGRRWPTWSEPPRRATVALEGAGGGSLELGRRYMVYRTLMRLSTFSAMLGLAVWLSMAR